MSVKPGSAQLDPQRLTTFFLNDPQRLTTFFLNDDVAGSFDLSRSFFLNEPAAVAVISGRRGMLLIAKQSEAGHSCSHREKWFYLLCQAQALKVFLRPPEIRDHPFQRADGKCAAERMIGDNYASSVSVPVNPMAASDSRQFKSLVLERPYEFTRCNTPAKLGHTLTATDGVDRSSAPFAGSTGIALPDSRRSST